MQGVVMFKVSDHVKGESRFEFYRAGQLWYKTADTGLEFPIPIEDAEGATFDSGHKSINLMRWIRKHLNVLAEAAEARA
jgi:hypothetical protein